MPVSGPFSHEDIIAHRNREGKKSTFEVALYSDAPFVGELGKGYEPYKLLSAHARFGPPFGPKVFLRIDIHKEPSLMRSMGGKIPKKTDTQAFTGISIADEVACIWSLLLGARLMAGDVTRTFYEEDPLGTPWIDRSPPISVFPSGKRLPILPEACEEKRLTKTIFHDYASLSSEDAIALVRAARAYRDALWIAEGQSALAWLLFVSALEIVADRQRIKAHKEQPETLLRRIDPKLASILEPCGEEHVRAVAKHLESMLKSTKRFLEFTLNFLPGPPARRPPEAFRADWSREAMEKSLQKIYALRSLALHGGIPFPEPMCRPPERVGNGAHDPPSEIEGSLAVSIHGATWMREDMPFQLHIFEYLTRNVLLRWWEQLTVPVT